MVVVQPCIYVRAEMQAAAPYFMPHPVSIYSGQTYQLHLRPGISFTHWQLRAHGGLLANGRIKDGAVELTIPAVVPGGRIAASLSLLDAEGGVHQGVLTLRVHSLPYDPETEELPDEVVLFGESDTRRAVIALFGLDPSVGYTAITEKPPLDLAIFVDAAHEIDGLINDIVYAGPRLADGFLVVVSVTDAFALPGLLQKLAHAESIKRQRSYLWPGARSAETACAWHSETEINDGWLPYFRREGTGREDAGLWGSVLLDFGEARVLVTRCNVDKAAVLTPEIYDAVIAVWGSYTGNRGKGNEK